MAKVFDDVLESNTITDSLDDPIVQEEVVEQQPVEDELPEKYRGKTPKEIIAMHQEAEKLIGKQGSEVGELRKVVDDFIKTQTSKDLKTQEPELEDGDFFVDPKSTVNRAIDNHPAIKQAKEASRSMKKTETLARIASQFPNYMEIVSDPSFAEWVNKSKVRSELLVRAENNFDFDSAHELLSVWQERQAVTNKALATSKLDRDNQLKTADVGTSNSSESVSKKKYRRSDIIKLMQTDPDRYDAMSQEIMAAYREGRVV